MNDKETSLAFVERMESVEIPSHSVLISREDFLHLRQIAKTAALIECNPVEMYPAFHDYCHATVMKEPFDFHGEVRAVADKIKEGK